VAIFIDTNILVYAAVKEFTEHKAAQQFLEELDSTPCVAWSVVYEFLRVTTHPRILPYPLKSKNSMLFISSLLQIPGVSILTETNRHLDILEKVISEIVHPSGSLFHDIHIAVLMQENGIKDIATADTDFLQFSFLNVLDPVHKKPTA